jgi:alpha-L-fucosidase
MKDPGDSVAFSVRITDAGDYKIILEYSCPPENSKQEGVVQVDNREYQFETLGTSVYAEDKPLLFIKHAVAVTTMPHPGIYTIKIHPSHEGKELFHLKTVLLEPVH